MTVSVTEAKNRLTQLLTAVEKGKRVTVKRHGHMTLEQLGEATRPMSGEEVDAFHEGRY
ncbi:MAG: hypothetical protein JWN34_5461 [Bryobacterales bacterium]|jgi:PHD/YefM family antitoxin component YafN of YafNO toxin-antitoxin module|nr:hypothetical protein [Bryobacterales bacterium]